MEGLTFYRVVCGFAFGHTVRGGVRVPDSDVFILVRKAVQGCRGKMADDILQLREDRV